MSDIGPDPFLGQTDLESGWNWHDIWVKNVFLTRIPGQCDLLFWSDLTKKWVWHQGTLSESNLTLEFLECREWIHFKLALFVYKCLNKTTPGYLSTLLSHYTPPRFLRSTLAITHLNVPRANTVLGQKAFSVAGPMIWNNLPPVIGESVSLVKFLRLTSIHVNLYVRCDLDGIAPYKF